MVEATQGPRAVVPDAYEAQGVLVVTGRGAALEDAGGLRLPFGLLLRELAGRRVRILIEPLEPREGEP